MKDILRDIQDLHFEVEEFIKDMGVIQSKFASRIASLDEYYNKEIVMQKSKSIIVKFESLKAELEAELEGVSDPFLSAQIDSLVDNIETMKSEVASLSLTLKEMGAGLVPKTLEKFARRLRKRLQGYFIKPMVSHTKKGNRLRSDLTGANGKKFFQTALKIKGLNFDILIVEPIDGDYSKDMPTSWNVFWEGRDTELLKKWILNQFKGKEHLLSTQVAPYVGIGSGSVIKLKVEIEGKDEGRYITRDGREAPNQSYHFMPGTVLKLDKVDNYRCGVYVRIIKINPGSRNELTRDGFYKNFVLRVNDSKPRGGYIIDTASHAYYAVRKRVEVLK